MTGESSSSSFIIQRQQQQRRRSKKSKSTFTLSLTCCLVVCCFVTLCLNLLHGGSIVHNLSSSTPHLLDSLVSYDIINNNNNNNRNSNLDKTTVDDDVPPLAGLSCDKYGGPSEEDAAQEMVYWNDIPTDNEHVSPFLNNNNNTKYYMTFEPDPGGWNNIRMSMETVLTMAHAMGRTLVLPPEQRMYLLNGNGQRRVFSFQNFYPMEQIAREHVGLNVITMKDFLEQVVMTGQLKRQWTNATKNDKGGSDQSITTTVYYPPNNRTDWDGDSRGVKTELNPWLRSISVMPDWDPNKCLASFPASTSPTDLKVLEDLNDMLQKEKYPKNLYERYVGKPVAVNASPTDRLLENLAERSRLCIYTPQLQQAQLLHFHGDSKMGGRLLVHFYAFLFFQSWEHDLWTKRFVRDHVRYVDEIQCAAARIVRAVRNRSRQRGNATGSGEYDSFHIRRGDFQYRATRVSAQAIYDIAHDVIPDGSTVYIGTDERDKSFFDDLKKHYDVVFLDDYMDLIEGLNPSYYGMLDQSVTSRGRFFFGCWFSTFTSYVNRLRGYHSQKEKLPGYDTGVIESYYYAMPERKMAMREFWPVKKAFHAREFPTSWMNIDMSVHANSSSNPQQIVQ